MQITWYGQASFGIESDSGLLIVTDPYDPETSGYKPFPKPANVVIRSSDNDDFHCNAHLVPQKEDATVITALDVAKNGGSVESHGITFKAVQAMEHVDHHLHDPDDNGMYRFNIDGIEIGHMGDMGNPFNKEQMDFFRGVDVLLALAGGFPVIAHDELMKVINETQPKIVIPMHFRTLTYKPRDSYWISEFLSHFDDKDVDFAFSNTATINKADLPESTRVLVVDYL